MKHTFLFILLFPFYIFSQQTQYVDFTNAYGIIHLNPIEKAVGGTVIYNFKALKTTDTISIDAINMAFEDVKINGKKVAFKNSGKALKLYQGFKKGKNELTFNYTARPKQTLYFTGSEATDNLQIWTQGQGKYTSHWFPSFDDVNEKVIFRLNIVFNKKYEVISNGVLNHKQRTKGDQMTLGGNGTDSYWNYSMAKPMSSYLLMLAIGKFESQTQKSASGIPLEMYYRPDDAAKFEPTYRYSKQIFDFFEKETGVSYPWEIYKQVPVRDFLYAGMENTSATTFAQDYVVDEIGFNDRNYINVNAHELAHQWFGDMVTAKSGKHHWLQEGFATYYALLAEKELFGENHFYHKLYDIAEQLQQASKTDTIPILNEKASSLSFYQKGAWALHVLCEGVGHENFRKAVKNYLEKYKFKNVDTDEFLTEIGKVSDYDVAAFRKRWLESPVFQIQEALNLLKKNASIRQYFEVAEMKDIPFDQKNEKLKAILISDAFYPVKEEVIFQLQEIPFDQKADLLHAAMQTGDLHVRQTIAQGLNEIPDSFKPEYETLLSDNSYITREIALNFLWSKYPENRIDLLNKTKDWYGMNDKNLRILWLTIALKTSDYEKDRKTAFYEELLDYASPKYETSTRQNAIESLMYLDKNDENYLPFLVNGLTSHKWQFSKYARDKIRLLIKKPNHRAYFEELSGKIPENEQQQLSKLLKE